MLFKTTGKIFYISEFGNSDELPDDIEDSDDYIEIPHKNELDLGKQLVFKFVSEHLPEELDRVSQIFRRRGAYSRCKESWPKGPGFGLPLKGAALLQIGQVRSD